MGQDIFSVYRVIRCNRSSSRLLISLSRTTPSAVSERKSMGFPIYTPFTTSCVYLALRPLSSTGISRLPWYYAPRRNLKAPDHLSRAFGWSSLTMPMGCPCCVRFLVYVLSPLSWYSDWRSCFAHPSSRISLPRYGGQVGPRIVLFEACLVVTQVTDWALVPSPYFVTRLTRGSSHFVTFIVAPVAAGWSGCRAGLAPTGKAPPLPGAHRLQTVASTTIL
jgi:hypothetical protein